MSEIKNITLNGTTMKVEDERLLFETRNATSDSSGLVAIAPPLGYKLVALSSITSGVYVLTQAYDSNDNTYSICLSNYNGQSVEANTNVELEICWISHN